MLEFDSSSLPLDQLGRPFSELRLSVTDRCNFRCRYCMPRERFAGHRFAQRSALLSYEELGRLVAIVKELGVQRVRLTGGEPLLRRDLPELVRLLAEQGGLQLALTTNGVLLVDQAKALRSAGLDALTVSLDALEEEVFRRMTDAPYSVTAVLRGIEAARDAGFDRIKVNCVIQRGVNEEQQLLLAEHFRHTGVVLRFIEYMDVGETNDWRSTQVVAVDTLRTRLHAQWPLERLPRERLAAPAERFRYADGGGEVGIIASVTQPFCGACSRARVSAVGRLHTCLFAEGGMDLRALLRSELGDGAIAQRIAAHWQQRADRYSELRGASGLVQLRRPEMSYLGG